MSRVVIISGYFNPLGTVKAAAETAMREVIARSNIQPILTEGRSVIETLKQQYNRLSVDPFIDEIIFGNGGDRTEGNSPEEEFCKEVGIRTVYGVGGDKTRSSSTLISISKGKDNDD